MSVGLQSEAITKNEAMARYGLEAYAATRGESWGATLGNAWETARYAAHFVTEEAPGVYDPADPNYNLFIGRREYLRETGKMLSQEEANRRYGIAEHLTFTTPEIPADTAAQLNIWKREELQRQDVLRRTRDAGWERAARIATGIGASFLDPVNVATAFIPIVGEARFATMVGKFGLTAARGVKGVTEAAVGGALVEPMIYLQARRENADYTLMDSLLNIGLGTAVGGGLHVGLGWAADKLAGRALPPMQAAAQAAGQDARAAGIRGAIASIMNDEPVRVGELLPALDPIAQRAADMAADVGTMRPGEFVKAAQRQLTARATAIRGTIARLEANNIGGRFNEQIARLEQEQIPLQRAQEIQATIARLESQNLGGRLNQQIAALRSEGDELARGIFDRTWLQQVAGEPGAAAPEAAPAWLQAVSAEAGAPVSREQAAAVAGKVLAGEALTPEESRIADVLRSEGRTQREAAAREATAYRVRREAERRATIDRMAEGEPTFRAADVAPGREIDAMAKASAATPTVQQDAVDVQGFEKAIADLAVRVRAAGVELPPEIVQADDLIRAAQGEARAFERAAFCLAGAA